MLRWILRRWLVAVVTLVALTATGSAIAAEQCVAEVMDVACGASTSSDEVAAPAPLEAGAEDVCDGSLLVEGDQVPMSLEVGASAVAPRTIHPVGDAVAKAPRSCDAVAVISGAVEHDDDRSPSWPEPAMDADLATMVTIPAGPSPRALLPRRLATVPPRGFDRAIEHPPRR